MGINSKKSITYPQTFVYFSKLQKVIHSYPQRPVCINGAIHEVKFLRFINYDDCTECNIFCLLLSVRLYGVTMFDFRQSVFDD